MMAALGFHSLSESCSQENGWKDQDNPQGNRNGGCFYGEDCIGFEREWIYNRGNRKC